jgi:hypothetical protein
MLGLVAVKTRGRGIAPAKHRVCDACGWTSYPRPEPQPGQASVTWVVPRMCDRCGGRLEWLS